MRELYNKVLDNLKKVDFEKLWNGFTRYEFALYTSTEVYFEDKIIPWNQRFIGNTAIKYEDRYIAIWDVEHDFLNDGNKDIDVLSANMIHEMFHAFQFESGETRFPRDLITLDYPDDLQNLCLKYEENKVLSDSYFETDLSIKKQLLEKFYSIRVRREKLIGEMCKCEYLSETSEGIAEYVGTMALKQLSEEKYMERMKSYTEKLHKFSQLQLNIRRISYFSGAVFLVVAHDLGISFQHPLSNPDKTAFEIVTNDFNYINTDDLNLNIDLVKQAIEENIKSKTQLINEFMESANRTATKGDFFISGYDPMNMVKLDNKIMCKTFISLTDINTKEKNIFMGETLLEMKEGTFDKVMCFYR